MKPKSTHSLERAPGSESHSPKGRGRPRDLRIDAEVVAVVLEALQRNGYRSVTIEGIANRLGRARTSLYRRWPSKRHLVAFAVVSELGVDPAADTGNLRNDLLAAVDTLRNAFLGPLGHALAGLVADMAQDVGLASLIRKRVLVPRRRSMAGAIRRAVARGELSRQFDMEVVLDMLTAPFYFRALFGHASMTRKDALQIVEHVLHALGFEGARKARGGG